MKNFFKREKEIETPKPELDKGAEDLNLENIVEGSVDNKEENQEAGGLNGIERGDGKLSEAEIEQVNNPSFMEKLHQKMVEVYKNSVDAKTYKNFYEKVKSITWEDIKGSMSKSMENQIVKTGGKISYDTASTLFGTKAITDWGMFALHKLGVKSSIKGDVHKYFAENDMERALLGITNQAIDLRQKVEGKGAEKDSEAYSEYKNSSAALAEAGRNFKTKVENLNVPEEKKKELRREFGLIMKEHKFQEAEISKGESDRFQQLMRDYTGNKVDAFKLSKDALNSALTFSGFLAARGIAYLSFSALEKGSESWDKFSREKYEAEKKEAGSPEDYPDWKSTYNEVSSEKLKTVLKEATVGSAKETYSELVKGRKNWKLGDAEQAKRDEKEKEKSDNLEILKKQLDDEGQNLFGKTWKIAWHKLKDVDAVEFVKENLVRLQAVGKIVRVAGVTLTGVNVHATGGSAFRDAYDRLITDISEKGLLETSSDNVLANNMFIKVDKVSEVFDAKKLEQGFETIKEGVVRVWDQREEIADAGLRKGVDAIGAVLSPDAAAASQTANVKIDPEKAFNESAKIRYPISKETDPWRKAMEGNGEKNKINFNTNTESSEAPPNITEQATESEKRKIFGLESLNKFDEERLASLGSDYDHQGPDLGKELRSNIKTESGNLTNFDKENLDKFHPVESYQGPDLGKEIRSNIETSNKGRLTDFEKNNQEQIPLVETHKDGDSARAEISENTSGASVRGAEKTPENHFQIAEKFEAEKNNNIWSMGEKYLRGNQEFIDLEGKHGVAKALETYNIDRIKDEIVAHPEKYGLKNALERILGDKYEKLDPADRELFLSKLNKMGKLEPIFRKLTVQDLNSINWQDAFDKEFLPPASKGITETLTDQQIKGVLASNDNEYEKRFGHEHHGRGAGHARVPRGIDAPPRATAELVPDGLEAHEKVPVETGPIDDTKIFVDSNLVIDKDSQFGKEYPEWAKRSADDFLHRRYGEALTTQKVFEEPGKMDYEKDIVHVRPDAQEMRNREELRGRLENARHIIGDPKKGETVGDFMARYNNENAGVNKALYDGLANSAALNGNADVKAEVWSIIDKMPGELKHGLSANFATNKEIALGYVKLFFSDRAGVSEGIKKFFDYQGQIDPESIKIKPDGSIFYENAFGKNNYDLQISKDKVGVDGPLFNNMKKTGLSLESIKNAKSFIIEGPVSKTVAEATMDMGKGGEVVSGKGTEVIKPEVKLGAGGEKVGAVVEKNIGSGKGEMLDISTESVVEKGGAGRGKMIDLDEASHEEKFNQATAEKIKTIDSTVSGADKKNFDALVSKFNKYSDNDLVKAIESAKSEEEKKLIAKAIAKVMEQRNLEDEKNF